MSTTVQISGLKELSKALHDLPLAVARKQLAKPVAIEARKMRDDAMSHVPVDTGRLQQALLIKRIAAGWEVARYIVAVRHGKKQQTAKKWGGVVDLDAYYWTFIEFGTSKYPAHPFLRPAFEARKEAALIMIINGLKDGVELEAAALAWSKSQ